MDSVLDIYPAALGSILGIPENFSLDVAEIMFSIMSFKTI